MLHSRFMFLVTTLCLAATLVLGGPAGDPGVMRRKATSSPSSPTATRVSSSTSPASASASQSAFTPAKFTPAKLTAACPVNSKSASGSKTSSSKISTATAKNVRSPSFSLEGRDPTKEALAKTISNLVDQYKLGTTLTRTQKDALVRGIVATAKYLDTTWKPDRKVSLPSLLGGITKVCWHLAAKHSRDDEVLKAVAKQTRRLANVTYDICKKMDSKLQIQFGEDCNKVIDHDLTDWESTIPTLAQPRLAIMENAASVTTTLYGKNSDMGRKSTKLWNERYESRCSTGNY